MMSVTNLKGLCTRYRNLIEKEMRKGEDVVSVGISEENPAVLLRNVETSVRSIKNLAVNWKRQWRNGPWL